MTELIAGTLYYYGSKLLQLHGAFDALLVVWLLFIIHKLVGWGMWVLSL